MTLPRRYILHFLAWTLLWAGLISVVMVLGSLLAADERGTIRYMLLIPLWAGIGAPIATYAALARRLEIGLAPLIPSAAACYLLIAFVHPVIQHERLRFGPHEDISEVAPFGPDLPSVLLRRRAHVIVDGPTTFSHSVNAPLETAPNWLTWQVLDPIANTVLVIVAGLLGALIARWNAADIPVGERRRIWLWGAGAVGSYLVVNMVARDVVRASVEAPAWLLAWVPLLAPAAMLVFVRRKVAALEAQLWTAGPWDAVVIRDIPGTDAKVGDIVAVDPGDVLVVKRQGPDAARAILAHPHHLTPCRPRDSEPPGGPAPPSETRPRLKVIP